MASKAEKLQRRYGANIADSLGSGRGGPGPAPVSLASSEAGPDRFAGRTKGQGGEMLIANIIPDPDQPRREFDQAELEQLAGTMRTHGQLQPIRVRWHAPAGKWMIIEGERRWRAAQIAGLTRLACVFVEEGGDELEQQLIANCCRSDLAPIDQARAFQRLMQSRGWNATQLADRLKLHKGQVSRALQLLELPPAIVEDVVAGRIVPDVAREIGKIVDPAEQAEVAAKVIGEKLNRAEGVAAAAAKRSQSKSSGRSESSKVRSYKTAGGCRVTLTFRRIPSEAQIREALQEVLENLEGEKAA